MCSMICADGASNFCNFVVRWRTAIAGCFWRALHVQRADVWDLYGKQLALCLLQDVIIKTNGIPRSRLDNYCNKLLPIPLPLSMNVNKKHSCQL